jgi:TRAP-type uncharacterized transport system substrate-binding protein
MRTLLRAIVRTQLPITAAMTIAPCIDAMARKGSRKAVGAMRLRWAAIAVLAMSTASLAAPSEAPTSQAGLQAVRREVPRAAKPADEAAIRLAAKAGRSQSTNADRASKERLNAWTLGLAAGRIEGAPLRFASELARVLDDGDNLRIVPMVTRGPFDNVFDLLYMRGVDMAIVYGDVLDYLKSKPEFSVVSQRVTYLMSLFPSEVHVFVRPEIKSLSDLSGKVVNFNTTGTAAAFTGPIVFKLLGIDVKATFVPHSVAMEKMRQGSDVAATFWVSSKPLAAFLKGKFPAGFKFLPIPYTENLEYYTPAYLENSDYPDLIAPGERIETVAVPAVLAVYDWPQSTDRYKRLLRLVDYLFDRFERLQKDPGYDGKWKDVNLAASVPGWRRFRPLQDKVDKVAAPAIAHLDQAQARALVTHAAPDDVAEQERLFGRYLEWSRTQGRQEGRQEGRQ